MLELQSGCRVSNLDRMSNLDPDTNFKPELRCKLPDIPISKIDVIRAVTALQPVYPDPAMHSFTSKVSETVSQTVGVTEEAGFLNSPLHPLPTAGSNRSMLYVLLTQFQTRYPTAHLTAELLMIHEGSYVVKALVQTDGLAIATSMAAAPDIEQAEDRAKVRALELLIQPLASNPLILPNRALSGGVLSDGILLDESERSILLSSNASSEMAFEAIANETPLPVSEDFPTIQPEAASVATNRLDATQSDQTPKDFLLPEVETAPDQMLLPQDSGMQTSDSIKDATESRPSSPTPAVDVSLASAIDLSDAIAQTTVELKRLGWTNTKGRNHLEQVYGKRSRQQLTDAELLDFLSYLEAQPSPSQTPF